MIRQPRCQPCRLIGVLLLLLFGLPGVSWAFDEPIPLVTGNDYRPFTGASLPEGGIATAIVRAAFAEQGHEVEIDFQAWRRGYRKTLDGDFAATFPYIPSAERREAYLYSDPILTLSIRPMVRAESEHKARRLGDLEGLTYCRPKGYAVSEKLAKLTETGALDRTAPYDMSTCVRMLDKERVDFIPVNTYQGAATARKVLGSDDTVRFLNVTFQHTRLHLIAPKKSPQSKELLATFNAGLAALRRDGDLQSIRDRLVHDFRRVITSKPRQSAAEPVARDAKADLM